MVYSGEPTYVAPWQLRRVRLLKDVPRPPRHRRALEGSACAAASETFTLRLRSPLISTLGQWLGDKVQIGELGSHSVTKLHASHEHTTSRPGEEPTNLWCYGPRD